MEKSHQLREEESRKSNAIDTMVTGEDGKTAMKQVQELLIMACFTKTNSQTGF